MLRKLSFGLFAIAALVLGAYLLIEGSEELSSLQMNSSSQRLRLLWKQDLEQLRQHKKLPSGFDSIKELNYTAMSKISAQWMSDIVIPIAIQHDGKYRLNLQVDHWSEKKKTAAVVHYQMIDIASGNTVWEFGRTYPIR